MSREIVGIRDGMGIAHVWVVGDVMCHPLADPGLKASEPTMFEWGYGGAGPRSLARAILFAVTADAEVAGALCQRFKWEVVATLPRAHWVLGYDQVEAFLMSEIGRLAFGQDGDNLELGDMAHGES